jgi:hypothetical protein
MRIVADYAANLHGFHPSSQDAELAPTVKEGVVRGYQNGLGIEEFCRQITWATFVCEDWKANLSCFLSGLSNELVIWTQVQYQLSEFVEQSLSNQQSDQSLPTTSIQPYDEVVFRSALHPKF